MGPTRAGRHHESLPEVVVSHVRRDIPLALLDVSVVLLAYLTTLVLRFEGSVPVPVDPGDPNWWRGYWTFVPFAALVHLGSNYAFRLYRRMWRYASIHEARQLGLAGLASTAIIVVTGGWLWPTRPLPLSVLLFGAVTAVLGFGAIRFQSRLFAYRRRAVAPADRRVLVVGAGAAGSMVLKDILENRSLGLHPVGVVDDDARKVGLRLHGVPVLGSRAAIPPLVERLGADEVLLAIPSATSDEVRDVAALCEEADVPLRVLPSVQEVVGGRVTARDIRDLRIEDLLGRQQVRTDLESVRALIAGRRVLVTGAGGSIGSEIARQVVALGPASLTLLDHDETHLHDLLVDLDDGGVAEPVLADIRDPDRIHAIFADRRPEVVFHAAAHKHVPILEAHPEEALRTNVIGTANVADAAAAAGTQRFVLISTDKAVSPTSAMGASKWLAERVVLSWQRPGSILCAVRFGNVLGSRGSVIPTFFRQIAKGGPVTITDPSMARYFMSTHEAVQLVLQAAALSRGGEVLTLDMGEPVNILALARNLIRLSGRVPGRDVEIQVVGARPGEKLVEEIVDLTEDSIPSGHPSILAARPPTPDRRALRRAIRELESLAAEGRSRDLAERMRALATNRALQAMAEER